MKVKVNKRRWRFALCNLVMLVLAAILGGVFYWITTWLPALDTAERWQGDGEMAFTQIACYLPVDSPKTLDEIRQFRRSLDQKLTENSLEAPEGGSLYADAWSASGTLTVTGDHGSASVATIGVGGNFFLFHPLTLRSGSYLSENDLMQDRVVLDETVAWTLFGSADVAGMSVTIDQKPYYVAGVIHREDDPASQRAYRDAAGMFLSYDAFYDLTQQDITCYEIVLPNMVSGFGMGLVEESFPVGTGELVENSRRYSLGNLIGVVGDFGLRSMGHNGVIYPYWENAVRLTEDWLAALLVLLGAFILCPAVTALVELIRALVKTGKFVNKKAPQAADRLIQRHREARYAKRKR